MPKIIPYNPKLKTLAKKLRNEMTFGEVLLWKLLNEDKIWGFDFDRQRCIDNYIVDFYCKELMLAIDIDGMSHNHEEAVHKDNIRQLRLESFGITVIRFREAEVKYDMVNVLRGIEAAVISIVRNNKFVKLPTNFPLEVLQG